MENFVKKYFKHILMVAIYTILFLIIYIVWFESLWHLWYVDVITAIVILGIGITIGYFYLKGVVKETEEKEKATQNTEIKEETKEVVETTTLDNKEVIENSSIEDSKDGE